MAIEWDVLVVEMSLLAAIIYGAIYVESWVQKRKARNEEEEMRKKILMIVANDMNKQNSPANPLQVITSEGCLLRAAFAVR